VSTTSDGNVRLTSSCILGGREPRKRAINKNKNKIKTLDCLLERIGSHSLPSYRDVTRTGPATTSLEEGAPMPRVRKGVPGFFRVEVLALRLQATAASWVINQLKLGYNLTQVSWVAGGCSTRM
jgi:hypothetical protein